MKGLPIERPGSITMEMIEKELSKKKLYPAKPITTTPGASAK